MSNEKIQYLHHHPSFIDYIKIVALEKDISEFLIEKDYYVMHGLFGLQLANYDFQLKGGTSLSKGYGLIDRISEDLDIRITPPAGLNLKTGKNHDRPNHILGRKNYIDNLAQEIVIDGFRVERNTEFDDEFGKFRHGGISLVFNSHFGPGESSAKPNVILEVGFDDVIPNKPLTISSWLYDLAASEGLEIVDNRAKGVPCYEPGYTFVEKLSAVSTKYRKVKAGGEMPENFVRHYYDLYCLLKNSEVLEFTKTDAFRKHIVKKFTKKDIVMPLSENPAFFLTDKKDFELLEMEYLRNKPLYYNGQPDFSLVMEVIRNWAANHDYPLIEA